MSMLAVLRSIEYKIAGQDVPMYRKWIDLDKTSTDLVKCIIAAEDNRFLKHKGYEWKDMLKARKLYLKRKEGDPIIGYSTISQQVAKNIFLFPSQNYLRKGLELYLTVLIEKIWGKKRIFEIYVNSVEMGYGIYGFETASQEYLKKSSSELCLYEAALLTALLTNPRDCSIQKPSRFLHHRCNHICYVAIKDRKITTHAEYLKGKKRDKKNAYRVRKEDCLLNRQERHHPI